MQRRCHQLRNGSDAVRFAPFLYIRVTPPLPWHPHDIIARGQDSPFCDLGGGWQHIHTPSSLYVRQAFQELPALAYSSEYDHGLK